MRYPNVKDPMLEIFLINPFFRSHSEAIFKATEPLMGYRWFDPKLYLTKEDLEASRFPRQELSMSMKE